MPIISVLLRGFSADSVILPMVSQELWSGLMLTLILSIVGIIASFPLAILLALGRQSNMPAKKAMAKHIAHIKD